MFLLDLGAAFCVCMCIILTNLTMQFGLGLPTLLLMGGAALTSLVLLVVRCVAYARMSIAVLGSACFALLTLATNDIAFVEWQKAVGGHAVRDHPTNAIILGVYVVSQTFLSGTLMCFVEHKPAPPSQHT